MTSLPQPLTIFQPVVSSMTSSGATNPGSPPQYVSSWFIPISNPKANYRHQRRTFEHDVSVVMSLSNSTAYPLLNNTDITYRGPPFGNGVTGYIAQNLGWRWLFCRYHNVSLFDVSLKILHNIGFNLIIFGAHFLILVSLHPFTSL